MFTPNPYSHCKTAKSWTRHCDFSLSLNTLPVAPDRVWRSSFDLILQREWTPSACELTWPKHHPWDSKPGFRRVGRAGDKERRERGQEPHWLLLEGPGQGKEVFHSREPDEEMERQPPSESRSTAEGRAGDPEFPHRPCLTPLSQHPPTPILPCSTLSPAGIHSPQLQRLMLTWLNSKSNQEGLKKKSWWSIWRKSAGEIKT